MNPLDIVLLCMLGITSILLVIVLYALIWKGRDDRMCEVSYAEIHHPPAEEEGGRPHYWRHEETTPPIRVVDAVPLNSRQDQLRLPLLNYHSV
jgi:hypothetical protein